MSCQSKRETLDFMSTNVEILRHESLIKPTGTIHFTLANKDEKKPLSLVDRKVMNVLIWHFQKNLTSKVKHNLSVDFLCNLTMGKSKNIAHLKKSLTRLAGTVFEWNSLGQDRSEAWEFCTFLTSGKLSRGIVHYTINPVLVEKLANPKLFAKIQLLIQTQFSRKYSLPMYEYFLDILCRERQSKVRLKLPVERIYDILNYQGEYKFFKKDILKPCVVEIHEKSDICLDFEEIREGRRIAYLTFIVERQSSYQLPLPIELEIVTDVDQDLDAYAQNTMVLLQDYGIPMRKAKELVLAFGPDYVNDKVQQMELERKNGKEISNLGGYLHTAIKDDYQSVVAIKQKREKISARQQNELKSLRTAWQDFRNERFEKKYATLSRKAQQTFKDDFVRAMQEDSRSKNPILKDNYLLLRTEFNRSQFYSKVVQENFKLWVKHHLLTEPEEQNFESYKESIRTQNIETHYQ